MCTPHMQYTIGMAYNLVYQMYDITLSSSLSAKEWLFEVISLERVSCRFSTLALKCPLMILQSEHENCVVSKVFVETWLKICEIREIKEP